MTIIWEESEVTPVALTPNDRKEFVVLHMDVLPQSLYRPQKRISGYGYI